MPRPWIAPPSGAPPAGAPTSQSDAAIARAHAGEREARPDPLWQCPRCGGPTRAKVAPTCADGHPRETMVRLPELVKS